MGEPNGAPRVPMGSWHPPRHNGPSYRQGTRAVMPWLWLLLQGLLGNCVWGMDGLGQHRGMFVIVGSPRGVGCRVS